MTINSSCQLCNGRTAFTYNEDKYSTVTRTHIMFEGNVICKTCLDELVAKRLSLVRKAKSSKKPINCRIEINYSFDKGDHIDECEND